VAKCLRVSAHVHFFKKSKNCPKLAKNRRKIAQVGAKLKNYARINAQKQRTGAHVRRFASPIRVFSPENNDDHPKFVKISTLLRESAVLFLKI